MAKYWFKWNGTQSTDKGIIMNAPTPIIKPEERVTHVTIPGRSGELTLTEGDMIHQSYIQTVHIAVHEASAVPGVEKWLCGSGTVIFSSQPGLCQEARLIGAVELEKHSRNLDWWEGDVQFYCSPVKYDVNETPITVTTSGTGISNPGDMTAYPLIEITGSGAVTVRCGGKLLTIPGCESGWVIDSEAEWIRSGNTPLGGVCSGEFPVLTPGANSIEFTGSITQLLVTPRIRYL